MDLDSPTPFLHQQSMEARSHLGRQDQQGMAAATLPEAHPTPSRTAHVRLLCRGLRPLLLDERRCPVGDAFYPRSCI